MNKASAKHIDELIGRCGLFSSRSKLEPHLNNFDFSNEIILITGAAGSIGSELSKQIAQHKFRILILIDIAESPLYNLIKHFEFHDTTNIKFVIRNITDEIALKHLFEKYKPTLIFHTAAYKHVPLMEHNAYEAIKTNIFGTKYLAELSIEHHIKKFIFISTDKAVNPISTMGLTKAIGEKYIKYLNTKSKTFFIATRFGNIIGSNGSLLPLLKKQIESGGPVTITNKETSRYFIDKQSACHLILEISTIQKLEHHLFTFEMGNPVRIIDIVHRVLLKYADSAKDIAIKYVGLRPGEKLHEIMFSDDEIIMPSENKKISIIQSKKKKVSKEIDFSELKSITPYKSDSEIKSALQDFYKHL